MHYIVCEVQLLFEGCVIMYVFKTLTVKVGRNHPDNVSVRTCLPVLWVDRGRAKMWKCCIFAWPF